MLAIDCKRAARRRRDGWEVFVAGGRTRDRASTSSQWAREAVERGAGEILLTSMDRDGTNDGYDLELTRAVAEAVGVPVIASGGAGTLEHLAEALHAGADAALAASIFHYGTFRVREAKEHLAAAGIAVRRSRLAMRPAVTRSAPGAGVLVAVVVAQHDPPCRAPCRRGGGGGSCAGSRACRAVAVAVRREAELQLALACAGQRRAPCARRAARSRASRRAARAVRWRARSCARGAVERPAAAVEREQRRVAGEVDRAARR